MIKQASIIISGLAMGAPLFGTMAAPVQAGEYPVPQLRLPLMSQPPVIDGQISAGEWSEADGMVGFGRQDPLATQAASYWLGADGRQLYVCVQSETQPGGQLIAQSAPGEADSKTYLDDSVELYVCPEPTAAVPQTFHGIFNAKGAIFDQVLGAKARPEWRGKWRLGNSVSTDRWICEIAIPWEELGVTGPIENRQMAIRIARNWQGSADMVQTEWSPAGGPFSNVSTMPRVQWDPAAPVVQVLSLQDEINAPAKVRLRLSNPGNTPLTAMTSVTMEPRESQSTKISRQDVLAAKETREVVVPGSALGPEPIYTRILVTGDSGKSIYYRRDFSWQVRRPRTVWTAPASEKTYRTKFSYFPTANAISAQVSLKDLPHASQVTGVQLAVRPRGKQQIIASKEIAATNSAVIALDRWDLPPLPHGDYDFVMTLRGVNQEPEIQGFEFHSFPWTGNKLGLSDVVVSPFTPIDLNGNTLGTVLRQHKINGAGLWDQVWAEGRPLLASPMRLEAVTGSRTYKAQGKLEWKQKSATHAQSLATWTAGVLQGSTSSYWDYDGQMRAVLHLEPISRPLDSLTLVIPLADQESPLFHACTDGLRFNYAGTTPAGTGQVWESGQARHVDIAGNYVPYIWLGGPERGLSVYGENDKGWITDPKIPCQEIRRTAGGTLELRLNLIQGPAAWSSPRDIEFGFLATPVKPMPDGWRRWTAGGRPSKKLPGAYSEAFLGSSLYWGALTGSDELYPRDADYTLWDKFKETRATGKIDRAYIDQWMLGYKTPDTPAGQRQRIGYKNHIDSAFYSMSSQWDGILPYTNPRGLRLDQPESRTYLDEWLRAAYPSREAPFASSMSYGVDPNSTFRDFSAYNWKKMLDTFADGIYWDNGFLASSVSPITSSAYVRPDGKVQPSAGLWNLRATVQRGAVLQAEMGRRNRNMVHMTNTAIAPVLSFTPSILSWEFSLGDIDFQDRFRRDDILASSIGRQFGAAPFVLTLIAGTSQEKNQWAARTAAGVMLTHELKPVPASVPVGDYWKNYDRLLEFGYGGDQVREWNYWEPGYPAKISGESSSLLLTKPGEALLVLCDWGEGGETICTLDLPKIGATPFTRAEELESGENLFISSGSTVKLSIKKHDFKVIHFSSP